MHLLNLCNVPILEQLRIEEALLRANTDNWCLINTGSNPAIVMGISNKPEQLLNLERVKAEKIPIIKRFSGGGTVYIDSETVFVTFIINTHTFDLPAQPRAILEWSEALYQPLFPGFSVKENDYVIGENKFGGNAQYIRKTRWLHHTSFLWDYQPEAMEYLLLPEKRPAYRRERRHTDFLCTLKPLYPNKADLIAALAMHFESTLGAKILPLASIPTLSTTHRQATAVLS